MHQKIDLLTDRQIADFETKVGDEIMVDVPDGKGRRRCQVTDIKISDAGKHPQSNEHLYRVILTLEP
jgi:hypothetical protein